MKIRLTRLASNDLDAVHDYIHHENPTAAVSTVVRVLEAIERLVDYPGMGRPGRVVGTRELVVSGTPFSVPYRVSHHVIWVLRVLHATRQWPEHFP